VVRRYFLGVEGHHASTRMEMLSKYMRNKGDSTTHLPRRKKHVGFAPTPAMHIQRRTPQGV